MKAFYTILVTISMRLLCVPDPAQAQILWEHPNGISGGQVYAIGTGSNGEISILPTDSRGFHSTDYGKTWYELTIPGGFRQASAIEVASTGTVFATFRYEVFRSDDKGKTWKEILKDSSGFVTTLEGADGKLYSVTGTNCWPSHLYISNDDGITWRESSRPNVPFNSGVSTINIMKDGTIFIHAPMVGMIMRSKNGGASWDEIGSPLFSASIYYIYSFHELADGSIIGLSSQAGLIKSTDRGDTWTKVKVDGYQPGNNTIYDATPDGTILYLNDLQIGDERRMFRIKDGKCVELNDAMPLSWQSVIRYDGKGAFYVGTQNALYKTTDEGDTWTEVMIPNQSVPSVIRTTVGSIIATSSSVGMNPRPYRYGEGSLMRSTDNGSNWTRVLSPSGLNLLARGPGTTVLLASGVNLYVSSDDGMTWVKRPTLVANSQQEYYPVYVMAFGKDNKLFATLGNTGLYTSTDLGVSWEAAKSSESFAAYALTIDSSGAVYTSGYAGDSTRGDRVSQFFRSTDNGASWIKLAAIVKDSGARSLVARGEKEVFAAIDRVGVLRTEDKGENWTLIDKGLPKIRYSSLHVNDGGRVILATTDGVYLLDDAKSEWTDISSNMVVRDVESLATTADGRLIAGSVPGVQRMADVIPAAPRSNNDTQVTQDLVRIALSNDVIGGGFDVQLQLKEELTGRLQVLDITGRIMLETSARLFAAGRQHLQLGQGLANGTYYVRFISSRATTQGCIGNLW